MTRDSTSVVSVDRLVDWCDKKHLIINTKKIEEIIFGLAPGGTTPPVAIHGIDIEQLQISGGDDRCNLVMVPSYSLYL